MKYLRYPVSLHQINSSTSDLSYNINLIRSLLYRDSEIPDLKLSIFPELAVTGYLKKDMFLSFTYIKRVQTEIKTIAAATKYYKQAVLLGGTYLKDRYLYNSIYLIYGGMVVDVYSKIHLVNYGPFDERRYFKPGNNYKIWRIGGANILSLICSDIIFTPKNRLIQLIYDSKIDIVIVCNGSPYERGKHKARKNNIYKIASKTSAHFVYINLVGGEDELVFDGGSFIVNGQLKNKNTEMYVQMPFFEEEDGVYEFNISDRSQSPKNIDIMKNETGNTLQERTQPDIEKNKGEEGEIKTVEKKYETIKSRLLPLDIKKFEREKIKSYNAIVISLRDYMVDSRIQQACVAISGGIDSSLVATIAVDSLGKDRVKLIFMPSHLTSELSFSAVCALEKSLGIKAHEISITSIFDKYTDTVELLKKNKLSLENLQSRIRSNILLCMSNCWNALVLCTSNKSESLVGFSTLGGDMSGGFAPIKDLLKREVYELATIRNSIGKMRGDGEMIPTSIISRTPTAELWENEVDEDSIGSYDDIEKNFRLERIHDFSYTNVSEDKRFYRTEFKKRQLPIGPKLSKLSLNPIEYRFPVNHDN